MFFGQHQLTIDRDAQVSLPPRFREPYAGSLYLIQGFDRNLILLPEEIFTLLYQRIGAMNITDPKVRLLARAILGTADEQELGQAGSITLREDLRHYAGIGDEVVAVGQGTYLELWSPETWQQQRALLDDADANTQRFAALDLSLSGS
ncbi:MAG: hypothetical protein ABIJ39_02075 [Chloroflexota bacterium]